MDEFKPEFNSSLQYLWRISNLLWSAHMARMDETTLKDELIILDSLHLELEPRMTEKELEAAQTLLDKASRLNKKAIREYFSYLNRIAHSKGLIMKDSEILPGVVRNTR